MPCNSRVGGVNFERSLLLGILIYNKTFTLIIFVKRMESLTNDQFSNKVLNYNTN